MRKRLLLVITVLFLILINFPQYSLAEGFGKLEWGMSKEQVENLINEKLGISLFNHSHFWVYMDQITTPNGCISYSSKFKVFDIDFDAVFSFDNNEKLKQIILYQEDLGDIEVLMSGGNIEKKFESYFTRQYGDIHKKNSININYEQFSTLQWFGNETFVYMINLADLKAEKDKYKHAIEIMIRQEDSPF